MFVTLYVTTFEGDFGKVYWRTVTTSLWNSDNPAWNTWVSLKLLIVLVRNKSLQEGLFEFLKHVGSFSKLLRFHNCKMYLVLYHLLGH